MIELVEEFVAALEERVASIQTSLETSDLPRLIHLAHQLKGASGGYGFAPLGEAAACLEAAAEAAQAVAEVTDEVNELISLCRRATSAPVRSNR